MLLCRFLLVFWNYSKIPNTIIKSNFSLSIGSLNVNSFNVSTINNRNSKSYLKVVGATRGKHDVIFLSDCRLKDKVDDINRLMGLNMNASYKLYSNSNRDSRGVAIAIKRNIVHEIVETHKDIEQNILLMKVKIKGQLMTLGSIYGPNENNQNFYIELRGLLEDWQIPFIIGGDFNTILDITRGEENLDRIGGGGGEDP